MIKCLSQYITGFFLIVLMLSCERITTWDIQPDETLLVADCIITNELKNQEVRLYQSADGLNQTPAGVSGAAISLMVNDTAITFAEGTAENGVYFSTVPFRAAAGNDYSLIISYKDYADTAHAGMVGITPFEDFDIVTYDSLYRFVYHSGNQASMTEVFYNWSGSQEYCNAYGSCQASETFYTLDNIDIGKLFAPDRQVIPFPGNTEIIRRKYSLSDEHQRFIRSLLLETEWRGGYFDVEQGNVPTNFSHGIRGWFAACMVLSDTTRVGK